jgi:hypothetical protein
LAFELRKAHARYQDTVAVLLRLSSPCFSLEERSRPPVVPTPQEDHGARRFEALGRVIHRPRLFYLLFFYFRAGQAFALKDKNIGDEHKSRAYEHKSRAYEHKSRVLTLAKATCVFQCGRMAKLTTLDAVRMNRPNPDAIVTAGELVELRFVAGNTLSLRAAKLFCLLIQEAGIAVADQVQHRVPYAVLNETFHRSRDELAEAIAELHSTVVSVQLVSRKGRPFTKSGPILSDVEREPDSLDDAEIRFEFSATLRRVIADSTHWTAVSRRAVLALESKYSLRLYLWLSLRANLKKTAEDVSLDDLRDLLGVPVGKLENWQHLKSRAIDPAFAEVNHLAGFHAVYRPLKQGRRVVGVQIAWGRKAPADLVKAAKELDRPRVGRTARRAGLVETMAQERHRIAESLANAPGIDRTSPEPLGRSEPRPEPPRPYGD